MKTMMMGIFDVHLDSDHRWRGANAIKLDAYLLHQREDGKTGIVKDQEPVVSLRIAAEGVGIDEWIDTTEKEKIDKLPPFVRNAYLAVVDAAKKAQMSLPVRYDD